MSRRERTTRTARATRAETPLDPHVEELLRATDEHVARRAWRTLDPAAERPRSLVELGRRVLPAAPDRPPLHAQQEIAWAMALSDLARAIAREFPENLFTDLDHVAASLRSVAAEEGHVALERVIDPLVRIHRLYGRGSTIRFRYVHDFLYGFDWARWVSRDVAARAGIGPFDLRFLAHIERRAAELAELVARDDPSYPPLAPGVFRNPFPFDRDPPAELALMTRLAREGAIPVPAWLERPQLTWNRPFAALREERASSLGLAR